MDADGSNQKQLTFDSGTNFSPVVSPDGRHIVFVSDRKDGRHNIWRMDADGANPKQLTNGNYDRNPSFSPDGKWIVYTSFGATHPNLWRVSIDGGEPVQLNDKFSVGPTVSPDGQWIACYYWDERPDTQLGIALVPFEGGQPAKVFALPSSIVRWAPDGSALTYVDSRSGVSNIWSQPLDGGPPVQLTNFKSDLIFAFEWSRDGRQLACARGIVTSDAVLFSNFS
jgi:Tol biopolymer transport system component